MSLNNIQLQSETYKDLFNGNLILAMETALSEQLPSETKIECLGENRQGVVFMVNDPHYKFLSDDEMEMLIKLLSACKLSLADIAVINFYFNDLNYRNVSELFRAKKILLFGVSTTQFDLPFGIPYFQIQSFNDQFYMTAPPLKDLLNNKELKKDLWSSLQKLFF